MKIILKEPIYKLGDLGDVVKVTGGYARNYLLPRGMALVATKANINQFEAERESLVKKIAHLKTEAEKVADIYNKITIDYTRKSGDDTRIFGSVTSKDIATSLKELGHEVAKRNILLRTPIKNTGETKVKIKLDQSVLAEITVNVIAEITEGGEAPEKYSVIPYKEDQAEVDAERVEGDEAPRRAKAAPTEEAPAEEAPEADAAPTEEAPVEEAPKAEAAPAEEAPEATPETETKTEEEKSE